jgi:hypothetical protein
VFHGELSRYHFELASSLPSLGGWENWRKEREWRQERAEGEGKKHIRVLTLNNVTHCVYLTKKTERS